MQVGADDSLRRQQAAKKFSMTMLLHQTMAATTRICQMVREALPEER